MIFDDFVRLWSPMYDFESEFCQIRALEEPENSVRAMRAIEDDVKSAELRQGQHSC